ncbi:hypothetical protein AAC387_Pa11g1425 [Persea americana]
MKYQKQSSVAVNNQYQVWEKRNFGYFALIVPESWHPDQHERMPEAISRTKVWKGPAVRSHVPLSQAGWTSKADQRWKKRWMKEIRQ